MSVGVEASVIIDIVNALGVNSPLCESEDHFKIIMCKNLNTQHLLILYCIAVCYILTHTIMTSVNS